MRVLVTGSSGQIGSFVVDELLAQGHYPVGLDIRPSARTHHVGDIRHAPSVERAMAGADAVVHCAANIDPAASIEDPAADADTNILGTLRVLRAARRVRIRSVVHVSSAAVYGNVADVPIVEETPCDPGSPYGVGKLAAERYALLEHRLFRVPVDIVRPFNLYSERQGPNDPYAGVVQVFIDRVRSGKPPIVFGDGAQTRDFVSARDVARFLVLLAGREGNGRVMNVGSGRETRILDLARAVMRAGGLPGEPQAGPVRPGDIRRSVASVERAMSAGFRPTGTLEGFLGGELRTHRRVER